MLSKGDYLPDISLKDKDGNQRSLSEFKGNPLVVYFYPKNETPGCVAEACSFRDQYTDFKDVGAEIVGISGDSVNSHQKFAQKRKLDFVLLSDSKRLAEKAFGVPRNLFGLLPGRVTFIADADGKIIHTFSSAANATKHVAESLKAIKSLNEN